jgi:hypothetical protein
MNPQTSDPLAVVSAQAASIGNGFLTNDVYPFVYGTSGNAGNAQPQSNLLPLILIGLAVWWFFF